MIAVDTNILVYAHRRESRFHQQARKLISELAEGQSNWAIPWPCIYEFFSVVTNPRIWLDAVTSPESAVSQIEAWSGSPSLTLLGETEEFISILLAILRHPRVRGAIVHDARIVALCIAHGVDELLTKDRDFQLFPELRARDPLAEGRGG